MLHTFSSETCCRPLVNLQPNQCFFAALSSVVIKDGLQAMLGPWTAKEAVMCTLGYILGLFPRLCSEVPLQWGPHPAMHQRVCAISAPQYLLHTPVAVWKLCHTVTVHTTCKIVSPLVLPTQYPRFLHRFFLSFFLQDAAFKVGKLVAERCLEKGVSQVCFDRAGYLYHGRVKVSHITWPAGFASMLWSGANGREWARLPLCWTDMLVDPGHRGGLYRYLVIRSAVLLGMF